jgi:hypothetical protein
VSLLLQHKLYWYSFSVLAVVYMATVVVMTRRLKARHYQTWDQLGRFSLFMNNSISNGNQFARYLIFTSAHKELNDPTLNIMAVAARVLLFLAGLDFTWGIILTTSRG